MFGSFGILKIEILTFLFSFSLTWDPTSPKGIETFKALHLQIAVKSFQTCPEFFPPAILTIWVSDF